MLRSSGTVVPPEVTHAMRRPQCAPTNDARRSRLARSGSSPAKVLVMRKDALPVGLVKRPPASCGLWKLGCGCVLCRCAVCFSVFVNGPSVNRLNSPKTWKKLEASGYGGPCAGNRPRRRRAMGNCQTTRSGWHSEPTKADGSWNRSRLPRKMPSGECVNRSSKQDATWDLKPFPTAQDPSRHRYHEMLTTSLMF